MNGELTEAEDGGEHLAHSLVTNIKDDLESGGCGDYGVASGFDMGPFGGGTPGDPDLQNLEEPSSTTLDSEELLQKVRNQLTPGLDPDSTIASPSDHSSVSSPGLLSPGGIHTPRENDSFLHDPNTQVSLIESYRDIRIDDHISNALDNGGTMWGSLPKAMSSPDNNGKPPKTFPDSDPPDNTHPTSTDLEGHVFSLASPVSSNTSAQFTFSKFGTEDGNNQGDVSSQARDGVTLDTTGIIESVPPVPIPVVKARGSKSGLGQKARRREPSLTLAYPSKVAGCELQILSQPEEQHRARYLTEGSRGAVKDTSQQGHPMVRLVGCTKPVTLQVYIGTDTGKVRPHGFYQACKVCGKNSTPCVERDIEGTTVIEIQLDPKNDMTALVDCVGILKLRNADVEQRIGLSRSKKKSTKARMVFRVNIPKADSTYDTLQVASTPILCTQPAGAPEISRKSLQEGPMKGGEELFIIGKNFMKGTRVIFEEKQGDSIMWTKEAEIDMDFFQATHLICTIPEYSNQNVHHPVQVDIVVQSSGKNSEPSGFTYQPVLTIKEEAPVPMETEPCMSKKVSPEALALNRSVQQTPLVTSLADSYDGSVKPEFDLDPDLDPPQKLVRVEDPIMTSCVDAVSSEAVSIQVNSQPHSLPLSLVGSSQLPLSVSAEPLFRVPISMAMLGLTNSPNMAPIVMTSVSEPREPVEGTPSLKREHTGEQKVENSRTSVSQQPSSFVMSAPATISTFPSAPATISSFTSTPATISSFPSSTHQEAPVFTTSTKSITRSDQQLLNTLLQQKDSLHPDQLKQLLKIIQDMAAHDYNRDHNTRQQQFTVTNQPDPIGHHDNHLYQQIHGPNSISLQQQELERKLREQEQKEMELRREKELFQKKVQEQQELMEQQKQQQLLEQQQQQQLIEQQKQQLHEQQKQQLLEQQKQQQLLEQQKQQQLLEQQKQQQLLEQQKQQQLLEQQKQQELLEQQRLEQELLESSNQLLYAESRGEKPMDTSTTGTMDEVSSAPLSASQSGTDLANQCPLESLKETLDKLNGSGGLGSPQPPMQRSDTPQQQEQRLDQTFNSLLSDMEHPASLYQPSPVQSEASYVSLASPAPGGVPPQSPYQRVSSSHSIHSSHSIQSPHSITSVQSPSEVQSPPSLEQPPTPQFYIDSPAPMTSAPVSVDLDTKPMQTSQQQQVFVLHNAPQESQTSIQSMDVKPPTSLTTSAGTNLSLQLLQQLSQVQRGGNNVLGITLQQLVAQHQQQHQQNNNSQKSQPQQVLQQIMSHLPSGSQQQTMPPNVEIVPGVVAQQNATVTPQNTIIVPMVVQQGSSSQASTPGFQFPTLLPQTITSNSSGTGAGTNLNTLFVANQGSAQLQSQASATPSSGGMPSVAAVLPNNARLATNTPIFLLTQSPNNVQQVVQVGATQAVSGASLATQLVFAPPQTTLASSSNTVSHSVASPVMIAGSPAIIMSTQSMSAAPSPVVQTSSPMPAVMTPAPSDQPHHHGDHDKLMEHSGIKDESASSPADTYSSDTAASANKKQETLLYQLLTEKEQEKQQAGCSVASSVGTVTSQTCPPNSSTASALLPNLNVDEGMQSAGFDIVELVLNMQAAAASRASQS